MHKYTVADLRLLHEFFSHIMQENPTGVVNPCSDLCLQTPPPHSPCSRHLPDLPSVGRLTVVSVSTEESVSIQKIWVNDFVGKNFTFLL